MSLFVTLYHLLFWFLQFSSFFSLTEFLKLSLIIVCIWMLMLILLVFYLFSSWGHNIIGQSHGHKNMDDFWKCFHISFQVIRGHDRLPQSSTKDSRANKAMCHQWRGSFWYDIEFNTKTKNRNEKFVDSCLILKMFTTYI